MYLAERIILSENIHAQEYALAERNARFAKQLYNAALFRLRQLSEYSDNWRYPQTFFIRTF